MNSLHDLIEHLTLSDMSLMKVIINDYIEGNYKEMARCIEEYGRHIFFKDLHVYLDEYNYVQGINQYVYFVGITIEYHRYIGADLKKSNKKK